MGPLYPSDNGQSWILKLFLEFCTVDEGQASADGCATSDDDGANERFRNPKSLINLDPTQHSNVCSGSLPDPWPVELSLEKLMPMGLKR